MPLKSQYSGSCSSVLAQRILEVGFMVLYTFFASMYGVVQLFMLPSLSRTIQQRGILFCFVAGMSASTSVAMLVERGCALLLLACCLPLAAQDSPAKPKTKPMGVWTDPATHLMWTNRDIDVDQDWSMAMELCESLRWNGRADWRLPTIDELQGIFDIEVPARTLVFEGRHFDYHIKGGIILTGREWSSTLARMNRDRPGPSPPAGALTFNFTGGEQVAFPLSDDQGNRALCVRPSEE
jgi:hypothetical protein